MIPTTLTTPFSRPERTNVVYDFESTILKCLCLSLPRSSQSLELVELLRFQDSDHEFQRHFPNRNFLREHKETVRASFKYIEVSPNVQRAVFLC